REAIANWQHEFSKNTRGKIPRVWNAEVLEIIRPARAKDLLDVRRIGLQSHKFVQALREIDEVTAERQFWSAVAAPRRSRPIAEGRFREVRHREIADRPGRSGHHIAGAVHRHNVEAVWPDQEAI